MGILLLGLAGDVAVAGVDVLVTLHYPHLVDPDVEPGPGELAVGLALLVGGLGILVIFAACVVLFAVWLHRANRNARALGARGMEFTPGWAVGWFFVPFANLFKPYQAVRETYHASHPDVGDDDDLSVLHWSRQPAPAQMKLWWGTWVVMNAVENASFRLSLRSDAASQATSTWLGVAGTVLAVPCTALVIWLILEIQDRQEQRHARQSTPPADAGAPAREAV